MTYHISSASLLQKLDQIKPDLKPLPTHYIASQDQHTRELYATMLAALLLVKGQVTEPETRLFGMLLQSMNIKATTAQFFERAQQLDASQLKLLVQTLSHQDQQCALMIDALILMRLDRPLDQAQAELLAELCDGFELSTDLVGHLIAVASMGLGTHALDEKLSKQLVLSDRLSRLSPITASAWINHISKTLLRKGVSVDPTTGLMWSRISIGQQWVNGTAQGHAKTLGWDDANKACQELRLAGFDDWRPPTKEELESLMIAGQAGYRAPKGALFTPNLNQPNDFSTYWSSSTYASRKSHVWLAYFNEGHFYKYLKSGSGHIRAVRAGY